MSLNIIVYKCYINYIDRMSTMTNLEKSCTNIHKYQGTLSSTTWCPTNLTIFTSAPNSVQNIADMLSLKYNFIPLFRNNLIVVFVGDWNEKKKTSIFVSSPTFRFLDEISNPNRQCILSKSPASVLDTCSWKSSTVAAVLPRLLSRLENQYVPQQVWWET